VTRAAGLRTDRTREPWAGAGHRSWDRAAGHALARGPDGPGEIRIAGILVLAVTIDRLRPRRPPC